MVSAFDAAGQHLAHKRAEEHLRAGGGCA
jgi:hypothetical protein